MKILTLDIETGPMQGYHWGLWKQNISIGQIIEPTQMLSFAGKFLDTKRIYYSSMHDGEGVMLERLHDLLSNCDAVVGWNSDKFDIKHINREFVTHGLPPVRPFSKIDLMKVVKRNFAFPSNKLDYVAGVLLGSHKLETGGFDLWPAFMEGEPDALRVMKKYNIEDVKLTEALYRELLPWIHNHPPVQDVEDIILDSVHDYECPNCGNSTVELHRPRRTRCFAVRQVRCGGTGCGAWFDGKRRRII